MTRTPRAIELDGRKVVPGSKRQPFYLELHSNAAKRHKHEATLKMAAALVSTCIGLFRLPGYQWNYSNLYSKTVYYFAHLWNFTLTFHVSLS